QGAVADRVVAVIGQPDRIVSPHMDAVRPGKDAFAPGTQEIAVPVEHHDRVLAAIKGIDVIVSVDADRGDVAQHNLIGRLGPIVADGVSELPAAELYRHASLPCVLMFAESRS